MSVGKLLWKTAFLITGEDNHFALAPKLRLGAHLGAKLCFAGGGALRAGQPEACWKLACSPARQPPLFPAAPSVAERSENHRNPHRSTTG